MRLPACQQGHKNQNWPIRSAFFHGANFSQYQRNKKGADSSERAAKFDDDAEEQAAAAAAETRQRGAHESLLVATGSADNHAYVFDVSLLSKYCMLFKGKHLLSGGRKYGAKQEWWGDHCAVDSKVARTY